MVGNRMCCFNVFLCFSCFSQTLLAVGVSVLNWHFVSPVRLDWLSLVVVSGGSPNKPLHCLITKCTAIKLYLEPDGDVREIVHRGGAVRKMGEASEAKLQHPARDAGCGETGKR
uniref:Putative secreted protein n=1 Tax=Anopheles darlingi TaxID=43151 RepID=A0A2M4DRH4_ANODA